MELSDFDLYKTDELVEHIPLIYLQGQQVKLQREKFQAHEVE